MSTIQSMQNWGTKGACLRSRDLLFNSVFPGYFRNLQSYELSKSCQCGWRESQGRASVV